jgi:membrane protease YdiL (CAAX protease family)
MVDFMEKIRSMIPPLAVALKNSAEASPAPQSADGHVMVMSTLVAVGVLVLVGWAVIRSGRREPLSLARVPGRPSRLGWPQLGMILAYGLFDMIVSFARGGRVARSLDSDAMEAGIISMLVILTICLVSAQIFFEHGIFRGLGLSLRRWFVDSARGVASFLGVFPVCLGLQALSKRLLPEQLQHVHDLLQFLQGHPGKLDVLLAFVVAVVMAPVVEEVLYRGLLQSALKNITGSSWKAILIASGFFAFIHLKVAPDPTRLVGLEAMAPLFALAVVLGYNYERTGRLWPSIVVHMLFNAVVMLSVITEPTGAAGGEAAIVNIIHFGLGIFN